MAGLTSFKSALIILMHFKPLPYKVSVRRVSLEPDLFGDCTLKKSGDEYKLYIRINKDAPEVAQLDALVHEWAHAMLSPIPELFTTHGPLWGVQYAECYEAVWEH